MLADGNMILEKKKEKKSQSAEQILAESDEMLCLADAEKFDLITL